MREDREHEDGAPRDHPDGAPLAEAPEGADPGDAAADRDPEADRGAGFAGAPYPADDTAPATPTGPTLLLLLCGEGEFGIRVEFVREVIEAPQVTRVPMAPAPVAGVAAVRGDILPIVDLGVRLRGVPTARAHRLVTVELERGAGRVGLLADDVVGMIQVSSPEAIEAVPEAVADHLPADVAAGVYAPSEDRLIVILDLDELLAIEAVAKER